MKTRILGRTGRPVSVIGLGTWQLGADWGEVDAADARAVLETSLEGAPQRSQVSQSLAATVSIVSGTH